jgi:hypothetical protein
MNSRNFMRKTRIAGFSALGLGVGLALSACNASGSSAGATATSTAATPQASATTGTTPTGAPGSSPTGGSGTSAAPQSPGGQSLVLADCEGKPVVKPTTYRLGCFDALNTLKDLRWTTWGQTATATGTEELNACVPACAPSQTSDYPVSIQMSGSRVTSPFGLHVYLYVTITYSGTMPTLQAGEAGGVVTQTQAHSRTIEMDTSCAGGCG